MMTVSSTMVLSMFPNKVLHCLTRVKTDPAYRHWRCLDHVCDSWQRRDSEEDKPLVILGSKSKTQLLEACRGIHGSLTWSMSMPVLEVVLRRASTEGKASNTKLCSWALRTLAWCATSRLPPFRACSQQPKVTCMLDCLPRQRHIPCYATDQGLWSEGCMQAMP